MIQDLRMGCTQIPVHLPGRRTEDREQVGCSQFRSSQETCLLPGGHPRPTPRLWGKGTCTRWYHSHMETSPPLAAIAFSLCGNPGSSGNSSSSGSGWGSGCQKGQSCSSWFWSSCLLPCCWLLKTPLKPLTAQCKQIFKNLFKKIMNGVNKQWTLAKALFLPHHSAFPDIHLYTHRIHTESWLELHSPHRLPHHRIGEQWQSVLEVAKKAGAIPNDLRGLWQVFINKIILSSGLWKAPNCHN